MWEILIVDDSLASLSSVRTALTSEGYRVSSVTSAQDVWRRMETRIPDLFLISTNVSNGTGIALCRELRHDSLTWDRSIVFVAPADDSCDVAEVLEAGADDCIRKPFTLQVLTARIRAHLRRAVPREVDETPELHIVSDTASVIVGDREVSLTRVEFDLLECLCRAPEQLHSTRDLLERVWQYPNGVGDTALVRNHIRNLRTKLEANPDRPEIIQSRHGRGYMIKAQITFAPDSLAAVHY